MMASRRRRSGRDINLDSLTDIMANTVGIMIFVMIFAVLAASGTYYAKRFPMCHPTVKKRMQVVCTGDRVFRYDEDALLDRFLEPLRKAKVTYNSIPSVVNQMNQRRIQDDLFEATGEFTYTETQSPEMVFTWDGMQPAWRRRTIEDAYVVIRPRPGVVGETTEQLADPEGRFQRLLRSVDKDTQYLRFEVAVDSVEVFRRAREMAFAQKVESNWEPATVRWPERVRIVFGKGDGGITIDKPDDDVQ